MNERQKSAYNRGCKAASAQLEGAGAIDSKALMLAVVDAMSLVDRKIEVTIPDRDPVTRLITGTRKVDECAYEGPLFEVMGRVDTLCAALSAVKSAGVRFGVDRSKEVDALGKMSAAADKLNETATILAATKAAPTGPIPVHVVGLPDRVTTSAIERNDAGEIVSTTQVERDAA